VLHDRLAAEVEQDLARKPRRGEASGDDDCNVRFQRKD